MMKIRNLLISLLFSLVCVFGLGLTFNSQKNAKALEENSLSRSQIEINIVNELENFIEFEVQDKKREGRTPGSIAEYNSAIYLKNQLDLLSNFKAVEDLVTDDGVQTFEFENVTTGKKMVSQNIVYRREIKTGSPKKVVLGAHYDSSEVLNEKGEFENIEGVNDSAASVATLLTFAKALDKELVDPGFTVEVVFFGAGTNAYDGSKFYVETINKDEVKDILLMVNLDKIALGSYNYIYVNEFKTTQEDYIKQTLKGKVDFKSFKAINVLDFSKESVNGLSYTHLGLESDHAYFMKRNINVLNFFSGNYEKALTFGINEYDNGNIITYTKNDNYAYIYENCIGFKQNLVNIYMALDVLLRDDSFVMKMQEDNGLKENYEFWTNEKLAVFLSAIVLIVFVTIYCIIYADLNKKSQNKAKETDIDRIVVRISKNLGDDDKMINEYIDKKVKDDTKNKDKEE